MKVMKIHPVARAFPTIPAKEMKQLKEDIAAHGIREALLVNKDKDTIYDGRNRWSIATELVRDGKMKESEVPMEVFTGNEDEITSMILSRNLFRRHLSDSQRAAIAGKFLLPKMEKEAAAREKAGKKAGSFGNGKGTKGSVAEKFASDVKVSVHKAKQTIRARRRGNLGSVISGKKSLKEAAGKPKPRKQKAPMTFADQVWDRFVRWIKYWPHPKHREVKELVATFLKEDRPIKVK